MTTTHTRNDRRIANPDGTMNNYAFGGPVDVISGASSGGTYTARYSSRDVYLANGSTFAAYTFVLPKNVMWGEFFEVASQGTVTAATFNDGFGNAIAGAPAGLAAHTAIHFRYINDTIGWIYWK